MLPKDKVRLIFFFLKIPEILSSGLSAYMSNCKQNYDVHLLYKLGVLVFYTATAIPFIYSFSGNSATSSAPISTFMCLWAIYIFPGSVYIFPPAEQADPSWESIIHLQTHECGNWDWGPDIPFLGIFVSNFRHLSLQCKACILCTFGFLKPVPPVLMIVFLGGIKYCRGSLGGQVFFYI